MAVRTLKNVVLGNTFEPALMVLGVTVGFVLLIACANVASLLLVRGVARSREMAVRAALGTAPPHRAAAACREARARERRRRRGLLLAVWGVDVLRAIAPGTLPRLDEIRTDGSVLAFTAALTLAIGAPLRLPAGAPGVVHRRERRAQGLARLRRRTQPAARAERAGRGEITLALVLLNGAGLSIRTFARIQDVPLGFNPDGVATMSLSLAQARYEGPQVESPFGCPPNVLPLSRGRRRVQRCQAVGSLKQRMYPSRSST